MKKIGILLLLLFSIGILRGYQTIPLVLSTNVTAQKAVVKSVPKRRNTFQRLEVSFESLDSTVQITMTQYPSFTYGDEILVSGSIEKNSMYFPTIEKVGAGKGSSVLTVVYALRQAIVDKTTAVFKQPVANLVLGIVFGIERELGDELSDQLRASGIMHVIVASGYNVSVVIAFIAFLTIRLRRNLRIVITITAILLYAAISGFQPPIIRASIMGGATLFALVLGRQKDAYLWLIYSAIIMLTINPLYLESISFQLSFVATLAILLFHSRVREVLLFFPKLIRDDFATTLSVQIFTTPLIYWHFGVVQPVSLFVNMLVLWLIPLIMLGGVVAVVIGFISVSVAQVVALPVVFAVEVLLSIVRLFA